MLRQAAYGAGVPSRLTLGSAGALALIAAIYLLAAILSWQLHRWAYATLPAMPSGKPWRLLFAVLFFTFIQLLLSVVVLNGVGLWSLVGNLTISDEGFYTYFFGTLSPLVPSAAIVLVSIARIRRRAEHAERR